MAALDRHDGHRPWPALTLHSLCVWLTREAAIRPRQTEDSSMCTRLFFCPAKLFFPDLPAPECTNCPGLHTPCIPNLEEVILVFYYKPTCTCLSFPVSVRAPNSLMPLASATSAGYLPLPLTSQLNAGCSSSDGSRNTFKKAHF